ncbi:MAG: hypothetical protein EAZ15_03290 [Sphingobacteriales bacterium]|nr:MAG: hypothetical protein EAZ15_03290 [Sphingobacteriales bacterium]
MQSYKNEYAFLLKIDVRFLLKNHSKIITSHPEMVYKIFSFSPFNKSRKLSFCPALFFKFKQPKFL